jgi:hypothetical protein
MRPPCMSKPVTVAEAARILKRSPVTVRRWVARGAPTARPGKEGRGNGSLVVPADLLRWKAGVEGVDADEILPKLATALADVFKRDAGGGYQAHRLIGIKEWHAAAYLVEVFERCALNWTGSIPDPPPDEIQILTALVEQTAHD